MKSPDTIQGKIFNRDGKMQRIRNLITSRWALVTILFICILVLAFGCGKKADVIEIGAILPLTGEAAKYGESAKNGLDLALEQINLKGRIRGKTLSIEYEDSRGDPKEGVSAIQKLITVNKVQAIIGAMASSVTLAIAPIAEKNEVVLLSPASSAPNITDAGDFIFRNCYSDIFEGDKMANYIYNETGYRRIGIIHINNDYGIGLRDAFRQEFTRLSGAVSVVETYDFGASEFRTQIIKVKSRNPDAVYIVGYGEMGRLLTQAKELGLNVPFFSCIMFEDENIIQIAGQAAEGVVYTFPSYDSESKEDVVASFTRAFENKYGLRPDGFAANTFDALKILALAIERGGETSDLIKEALYSIQDYPGVTGETSFDNHGDVVKPIGIKEVVGGEFTWIFYKY